jgi:hypothetical protein
MSSTTTKRGSVASLSPKARGAVEHPEPDLLRIAIMFQIWHPTTQLHDRHDIERSLTKIRDEGLASVDFLIRPHDLESTARTAEARGPSTAGPTACCVPRGCGCGGLLSQPGLAYPGLPGHQTSPPLPRSASSTAALITGERPCPGTDRWRQHARAVCRRC